MCVYIVKRSKQPARRLICLQKMGLTRLRCLRQTGSDRELMRWPWMNGLMPCHVLRRCCCCVSTWLNKDGPCCELTDQKGGLRSLHPPFILYRQAQKLFNSRTRPLYCMRLLIEVERGINMQRGNSIRILFMSKPIRKSFKKDESLSSPMYTFNAFNIQPNKEKVYMCCTQHRAPARMFRFTAKRLALDGGCCLEGFFSFWYTCVHKEWMCAVFLCGSIHSPWWCEVNKSVACRVGRSRLPYTWERQTLGVVVCAPCPGYSMNSLNQNLQNSWR